MKSIDHVDLGSPSLGNTRQLVVHRYGKAGSRPKAYLQASLHADEIPRLLALNKTDLVGEDTIEPMLRELSTESDAVAISARNRESLTPLLSRIERLLGHNTSAYPGRPADARLQIQ